MLFIAPEMPKVVLPGFVGRDTAFLGQSEVGNNKPDLYSNNNIYDNKLINMYITNVISGDFVQ